VNAPGLTLLSLERSARSSETRPRRSAPLSPLPSLQSLLQKPLADLRELGRLVHAEDKPFDAKAAADTPVSNLARVTERLVPMIDSFRRPKGAATRWWQKFSGQALERDLNFWHACSRLEATVKSGQDLVPKVHEHAHHLQRERHAAKAQAQWLAQVVLVAQKALQPQYAEHRQAPAFAEENDYWPRFARRADNLNALHSALLLNAEQMKLAQAQARAVLDRFTEVMTVLMPLWRQQVGFELFAKQFSPPSNEEPAR
jgi:hypothetical protein